MKKEVLIKIKKYDTAYAARREEAEYARQAKVMAKSVGEREKRA